MVGSAETVLPTWRVWTTGESLLDEPSRYSPGPELVCDTDDSLLEGTSSTNHPALFVALRQGRPHPRCATLWTGTIPGGCRHPVRPCATFPNRVIGRRAPSRPHDSLPWTRPLLRMYSTPCMDGDVLLPEYSHRGGYDSIPVGTSG